jgi:hypothetical protein
MSVLQKRKSPASTGLGNRKQLGGIDYNAGRHLELLYGRRDSPGRLPANWRDRLPAPDVYYRRHVDGLGTPNAAGWASARCPFHDEANPSFSAQLIDVRGGWRCFANCGAGDLVGFHMRRTGLSFTDAVRELLGWRA